MLNVAYGTASQRCRGRNRGDLLVRPQLPLLGTEHLVPTVRGTRGKRSWSDATAGCSIFPRSASLVESFPPSKDRQPDFQDPLAAVNDFHRQLADRGIQLLVVPVPGKASIYPDRVSSRADPGKIADSSHTLAFISRLNDAGIPTIDLFGAFHQERRRDRLTNGEPLYLRQDTHWTPEGAELAAQTVAQRVLREGWVTAGSRGIRTKAGCSGAPQ